MKRAFTIVELLVAIGLFGILLAVSGIIFATAVDAHRTAEATTEISQNLAAITDQLNADFRGLRKDCPIAIWFEAGPADPCDPCSPNVRHDQILFFADGDFQSYRYNPPLTGNTARVYYGQANIIDYPNRTVAAGNEYFESNILSRRQHIYSPFPPEPGDPCFPNINFSNFLPQNNDRYEYDNIALSQWKTVVLNSVYNTQIITTCFDNIDGRCGIDLDNAETLHMLMAQGVGHFQIQWSYFWGGQLRWWPSTDPDGNGDNSDSDFPPAEMFGIYFNMPATVDVDVTGEGDNDWRTFTGFFPQALKFTFTLYDSKGIFKEGKTFTHIVYLDG
ncbi:MAG: hypothetical protein DRP65_00335 [Planctomycetota bacterium]|nr:MAG: hypothetical protein DRP65_00335 [Planctomycetota bacterium]